jgi:hypothetical protein
MGECRSPALALGRDTLGVDAQQRQADAADIRGLSGSIVKRNHDQIEPGAFAFRRAYQGQFCAALRLRLDPQRYHRHAPADGEGEIGPWRRQRIGLGEINMVKRCLYARLGKVIAGFQDDTPPLEGKARGLGQALSLRIVALLGAGQKPDAGWGHSAFIKG